MKTILSPSLYCSITMACQAGTAFAEQFESMDEVWEWCENPFWLMWMINRERPPQPVYVNIMMTIIEPYLVHLSEYESSSIISAIKSWMIDNTIQLNWKREAIELNSIAAWVNSIDGYIVQMIRFMLLTIDGHLGSVNTLKVIEAIDNLERMMGNRANRSDLCPMIRKVFQNPFIA